MALVDHLRAPVSLVALSASYVVGRAEASFAAERGLGKLSASLARARAGATAAVRIGMAVRRAPVLRRQPALLAHPDDLIQIASLVSDTHVIAPGASLCELDADPGQWPWQTIPSAGDLTRGIRRVLEHIAAHGPDTVIWCGDEVDSGEPAEWQEWRAAVDAVPRLAHRLVPGNHDICFNRPFDADYTLARRAWRERAYQDHAGRLADFPVVDTLISDAGPVTLVLLDSCRHRSTHILSNAVGRFGDDQLAELSRILDGVRGPVLCISHHHIWRDLHFLSPEAWYNTVVDADRLVDILSGYRRRSPRNQVLVCHGHRHALTAGMVGDSDAPIAVVGLPSTTLGDKSLSGMLDGVLHYGVAGLRRDGSWGVGVRRIGRLVPAGKRPAARPSIPPSASIRALAVIAELPDARTVAQTGSRTTPSTTG